jgi:phage regulator Rha-like protein
MSLEHSLHGYINVNVNEPDTVRFGHQKHKIVPFEMNRNYYVLLMTQYTGHRHGCIALVMVFMIDQILSP